MAQVEIECSYCGDGLTSNSVEKVKAWNERHNGGECPGPAPREVSLRVDDIEGVAVLPPD